MSTTPNETPEALLTRVLDTDRTLRKAREAFHASPNKRALAAAVGKEVDKAFTLGGTEDAEIEGASRLICMTDLLAEIGGVEGAQLLLKTLGHPEPAVRVASGEALVELLYDRYAEVARVIETEVERGGNPIALAEVPFILAEVGEPGGAKIMTRLLAHKEPEVVGAAIEGLAALGDPTAARALEPLRNDRRTIQVDDESEGPGEITLGDLAAEAIEHLRKGPGRPG